MERFKYIIRKLGIYSFFLIVAGNLCGCIDNPVIPQGSISGTVYDVYTMQNPYMLVSVGEYPVIGVDGYGKFTIENVSLPYNLDISRYRGFTTKYLGLNSNNINVYEHFDFGSAISCITQVNYPAMKNKYKRAFIKFISEDISNQFNYIFYPPDTNVYIDVNIPLEKSSITGKVIYLESTIEENGNIISYDKFGFKTVTLYPRYSNNPIINFSEEDIIVNPQEEIVLYSVIAQNHQFIKYTNLYLSFPGTCRTSDSYMSGTELSAPGGMFVVPVLEGINYQIMISSVYSIENLVSEQHAEGEKWVYVNPGENAEIVFEASLSLIEPEDNQSNINDESIFRISDEDPNGIYVYYFRGSTGHLSVYTDKKSLKFNELKSRNFSFSPNSNYYWGVRKYSGYNSIDEFASLKFTIDTSYSSIPVSIVNSFKTAP